MLLFDVLAVLTLVYWLGIFIDSLIGLRSIKEIQKMPNDRVHHNNPTAANYNGSMSNVGLPFVSVIVAARNEEKDISRTIKQLLAQDYPAFEVIAVNDRSTDGTANRLSELQAWWEEQSINRSSSPTLKQLDITELPDGWIGKNHALYQGVQLAKGEYLLFTDADVRFDPAMLRSAVAAAQGEQVDLLTLSPQMEAKHFVLRLFVHYFLFSFTLFKRLWVANNDKQHKYGVGIGAFNLIKKSVYEEIGTHRSISMRPDDDLQLGMKVKQGGFRQRVHTAKSMLQVEWYPTLKEAIQGLEKNAFAGLHYSYALAFFALFGQLFVFLFPFIAIFIWQDWKLLSYGLTIALIFTLYLLHVRKMSSDSGLNMFLLPVSVLLFCFVFVRAILLTMFKGGIVWRGTFYRLTELRKKNE
ncbi:glycosyltransferase [Bacillus horti]|uniref:Cellulose synthase/poly-beta-1,6-N-acetylglucosamine synthase-like glycosyltransferase n=1 Tax=Caldalkalibacillus horti TaxID=77523 RepID=A0ABT9VVR6_9BACI|nr:glycosyltransferase [Bacillus horti]MDQ0165085.1 cellulose synthase/poly-beta-1,6-N-acetylglucosamine synthase-like glycosyltransferase [Bacillus horti]